VSLLLLLGLFTIFFLFFTSFTQLFSSTSNLVEAFHFHTDHEKELVQLYSRASSFSQETLPLQPGDYILSINEESIESGIEFIWTLLHLDTGTPADFTILRDGALTQVTLTPKFRLNTDSFFFAFLPSTLFSYALFLIALFVLLKKIESREGRLFYLMLLFWALAMRLSFQQGYLIHSILPLWLEQTLLVPLWPLAVGSFLHFHLIFPVERALIRKHPGPAKAVIYAPLLLVIPYFYALYKNWGWSESLLNIGWGIWLTVYFLSALVFLGYSMRHAPNPHIRKQIEIMLYGTAVSLGLPCLFYFVPTLLFGNSFPYAEFVGLLVIFWPIILAYVVVKHRLMNIDFIIKRSVSYALISGFVVSVYVLLVIVVGQVVLNLSGATSQFVTILATLLIAALFSPVKDRIQNFVDRRFYPSRFSYREAIRNFGHELVNVLDLQTLLDTLSAFLTQTMQIRPVAIYWQVPSADLYKIKQTDGTFSAPPSFRATDSVVERLKQKKALVDFSVLKKEMLTDEGTAPWRRLKTELVLPLLARGKVVGFLSLGPKDDNEPYFNEDLDLLQSLNDRINISLENALLMEELREQDRLKKELEVARRIQLSSLPQHDPQVPGLDVCGASVPAMEVGGDYYDYIEFPDNRFGVVVGDVSGKGTSAAFYMSQLKGVLNTVAKYQKSLKKLMVEVNAITCKSIELQSFITLTFAAFNLKSKKVRIVRAGHLPVLHFSQSENACREIVPKGIGIGLEDGPVFQNQLEEIVLKYRSGDLFLFFSDGIIEARNRAGEEFQTSALMQMVEENSVADADALRDKILTHVQAFSDEAGQKDDMTLVVVKVQ